MVKALPGLLLLAIALVLIIPAYANPTSYILERTIKNIHYNGSLINDSSEGSVEVETSDTRDVLQNVRIVLSSIGGTNLANSTAYAAVAASPQMGDRTRLYLTTNESNMTTLYRFNNSYNISISISRVNEAGGQDLAPGQNYLVFKIVMEPSQNLSDVQFIFQANRNTFLGTDSMNILEANCTSGSTQVSDSDGDIYYDRVTWSGNLDSQTNISLRSSIISGVNYQSDEMKVDTDSGSTRAGYSQAAPFSGISFSDRFSRGSIRQGVEIMPKTNWTVRGFMKNIGYGNTYRVNDWYLYEVGSNTSAASGSISRDLSPGENIYTDLYDTSVTVNTSGNGSALEKPIYYSSYFDWEVIWGASMYQGLLDEMVSMPTIYQIDIAIDKSISLIRNEESGRILQITDEMRHIGHANLEIGDAAFRTSYGRGWVVSNLKAFKRNASGTFELNISDFENLGGVMNISLENISIAQNEFVLVIYNLTRGKEDFDRRYDFDLAVGAKTKSGTPVDKTLASMLTVPGLAKLPGGGGGGIAPLQKNLLEIVKKDANDYFITDSLHFNEVSYQIIDTGDKGLRNPLFFIYLPEGADLDTGRVQLYLKRNNTETQLNKTIRQGDPTKIGEETYVEYRVQPDSVTKDPLTFHNGDVLTISYYSNLPFGTSMITTRAYGYNYYEDSYISEDVMTYVRREYWMLKNLAVKESGWENFKIEVGNPARWLKTLDVKNPNEKSVRQMYSVRVPESRLGAHVRLSRNLTTSEIEAVSEKNKVSFLIDIGSGEQQVYMLDITTQPVLETKRETQILDANKTSVTFSTLVTLQNFADLQYENISFMIPDTEVVWCNYEYKLVNGGTEIIIPLMKGGETVTVNFTSVEEPPKVIINLGNLSYSCEDSVSGNILVVPKENVGYIEIELSGPNGSNQNMYADLLEIKEIPTKVNLNIPITKYATGNYTLYVFYKKNFNTVLASKEEMEVVCKENLEIPWIIFFLLIIIVVIIARRKIYRKKTLEGELEEISRKKYK